MPFRNLETLESWVAEFRELGYPLIGSLKVIVQDGEDGADTGLVGVRLANAATVVYIQPASPDGARWVTTMEPRETAEVLDSADLLSLSSELATVSALCAFLQSKSQSYTATTRA